MFIFTHTNLKPSAVALARKLEELTSRRVLVTTNPNSTLPPPIIRWGTSVAGSFGHLTKYNPPELISVVANKYRFSQSMIATGLPCVEVTKGTPERFPVVIRKILEGCGGVGIDVCTSLEEFNEKYRQYFWSYWRDLNPELGVHIFNGRILKIFKKVRDESLPPEQFPIRNMTRGWNFSRVKEENFPKLIPGLMSFYEKFPIAFGRLDIGWDRVDRVYRIIEMNSAPGIAQNPDTTEAYAKSFAEVLK